MKKLNILTLLLILSPFYGLSQQVYVSIDYVDGGAEAVGLMRYYHPGVGDHFYTTNGQELSENDLGYKFESIMGFVFISQQKGTCSLYRYYNPGSKDHFYTTNFQELGNGGGGYTYEGIIGYLYPEAQGGTIPLYRYFNKDNGDHFYTTNFNELGKGRQGYVYEGIAGYVLNY